MRFTSVAVTAASVIISLSSSNHPGCYGLMYENIGWQSGPSAGPQYAGEMYFDDADNTIYFTGETYDSQFQGGTKLSKSNCLAMSFDLASESLKLSQVYGEDDTIDFCTGLTVSQPGSLIYIGNSEPNGWSKDFLGTTVASKLYGIVAVMGKDTLSPIGTDKTGHSLLTSDITQRIPYPQDVCTDSKGNIWIVSLTSTDTQLNQQTSQYPNWLHDKIEYGNSVDMTISRYSWTETGTNDENGDEIDGISVDDFGLTLGLKYFVEFPMDPNLNNGDIPRVYIGGLFMKNVHPSAIHSNDENNPNHDFEFLIVAGSTRGESNGYGPAEGSDEDGFISFIDRETGHLLDLTSDEADMAAMNKNNVRIGSPEDDIITGICNHYSDPNSFFVVGATKGNMVDDVHDDIDDDDVTIPEGSLQGFVSKMNIDTLEAEWTRQFFAIPSSDDDDGKSEAYAVSCIMDDQGLYVTGNVERGGSMYDTKTTKKLNSNGGADIFVVGLDIETGSTKWMKQVGTPGNDRIARHGGIDSTNFEVVLIYGETNGNLFREREDGEDSENIDLFVMSMMTVNGSYRLSDVNYGDDDDDDVDDDEINTEITDTAAANFEPRGLQIAGDMYPGSIVYDSEQHDVKFTGGSYQNDLTKSMCFSAVWDLTSNKVNKLYHTGNDDTEEACNAIAWSPFEDKSYTVGFTDSQAGGEFYDHMTDDAYDYKVLGTILQSNAKGQPVGGSIIQEENVQYPVAVITHPSEDYIFVASLSSEFTETQSWDASLVRPDLTVGGHHHQYGHSYFVSVARYVVKSQPSKAKDPLPETLDEDWYSFFNVQDNPKNVIVTDMALAGDKGSTLVLVGSTNGSGNQFGTNSGTDMDGWMLKLDPTTGKPVDTGRASTRIDSSNSKDDWVNGICVDKFDPNGVFIVGATMGKIRTLDDDHQLPDGDIHAFIAKVSLENLEVAWLKHFTMKADQDQAEATAFSCVVAPGEGNRNVVYIAGTILDGAVMDGAQEGKSAGGSDIFVIQMDDDGGKVNWIRQVGTPADDRLAEGQGIDVDVDGNVIVYGDTKGAFYSDSPSGKTDLVAFTMSRKDGAYAPIGADAIVTDDAIVADYAGEDIPPVVDPGGMDDDDDDWKIDTDNPENLVGYQTVADLGPTYAGGMAYDKYTNSLYVTGATYGDFSKPGSSSHSTSQCIFGVMTLPNLQWKERKAVGTENAPEACSAIALGSGGGKPIAIVAGSTEKGGLFTETSTKNADDMQFGFLMDLVDDDAGKYSIAGNALLDSDYVEYPAAVLTKDDGTVYVASMSSTDTKITADYEKVADDDYPNFTSGGIEKYGSQYEIVMEQFTIGGGNSITKGWRKPFETADLESVFVSGLIEVNEDAMVVVGSTRASTRGDDMDGIMAKIKKEDGGFYKEDTNAKSVAYFASVDGADDWIMNACPNPDDPETFYVVGATASKAEGSNALNALVAKVRLYDLGAEWTTEIGVIHASGDNSKHAAAAVLGCDSFADMDIAGVGHLYIAGTVENGARIDYPGTESAGRDDIFVARLESIDGRITWLKQLGSNGDDRLARGGGIKLDENGNPVLFGDTNGEFYRWRRNDKNPQFHDLFFLVVDAETGTFQPPLVGKPFKKDESAPKEWFGDVDDGGGFTVFLYTMIILCAFVLFVIWFRRNRMRFKAESQKTSIFAYLQQFDVEDIDLRKSPPGGWHGTYLNRLAYGINKSETEAYSDEPYSDEPNYNSGRLSHSSIVSDSLFMDTASTPSLGGDTTDSYDDLPSKYRDGSETIPGREII